TGAQRHAGTTRDYARLAVLARCLGGPIDRLSRRDVARPACRAPTELPRARQADSADAVLLSLDLGRGLSRALAIRDRALQMGEDRARPREGLRALAAAAIVLAHRLFPRALGSRALRPPAPHGHDVDERRGEDRDAVPAQGKERRAQVKVSAGNEMDLERVKGIEPLDS